MVRSVLGPEEEADDATGVHHSTRRRGGVAARGTGAAADTACAQRRTSNMRGDMPFGELFG